MQIIIISPNNTSHIHWHLSLRKLYLILGFSAVLLVTTALYIHQQLNISQSAITPLPVINHLSKTSTSDAKQEQLGMQDYYAKRLGQLQAESIRLTALTEKLAEVVGIDTDEFQLDMLPAQGGIDEDEGASLSSELFSSEMTQLTLRFGKQEQQLATIQHLYLTRDTIQSGIPQGSPVSDGWLSSYYGKRIDPFTGKKTFHPGLDFAGKAGSEVVASADGMVTFAGTRSGYGKVVELDHGNGYSTLYGHNKELKVKNGDVIKKGQVLALMGSTGRSTGPHVHYEVSLDGKRVDPYKFVKR